MRNINTGLLKQIGLAVLFVITFIVVLTVLDNKATRAKTYDVSADCALIIGSVILLTEDPMISDREYHEALDKALAIRSKWYLVNKGIDVNQSREVQQNE